MSGEVSYFSRFFVKFVEIIAAGLASAMCAYLLAHFAGLLSSPTPASAPALTHVQVDPAASGVAARSTPPLAASAANEHPAPQQDAPEAKLAPKAGKGPKVLPPSKHTKPDTSGAEKERRSQESAEPGPCRASQRRRQAAGPGCPGDRVGPHRHPLGACRERPAPAGQCAVAPTRCWTSARHFAAPC